MADTRVLLDVLTPKQVLFFSPVVSELRSRGVEVLVTSRQYREVEPMAKLCRLELEYIGERGGKDLAGQLIASTKREAEMIPLVRDFGPNVALSVASTVCARVAFGLRVPHIAVNDSPHSEVAGRLSLPLSELLMCPWVIPLEAWSGYGLKRSQIRHYHALDPAAWLKRKPLDGPLPRLEASRRTITVRLEESYAPYLIGTDSGWADSVLGAVGKAFPEFNLVALCRYQDQVEAVRERFGSQFMVPEGFVDGRRLLSSTDIFIGMGGTMSAEAALMGVPTISAFQGSLYTERYLKSVGLLSKAKNTRLLVKEARRLLEPSLRRGLASRARRILSAMEDPIPKVIATVLGVAGQT